MGGERGSRRRREWNIGFGLKNAFYLLLLRFSVYLVESLFFVCFVIK